MEGLMKKIIVGIFTMVFIQLFTNCASIVSQKITFRPVTVVVLDSETGIPLEGMQITVVNDISLSTWMLIDN